MPSRKFNAPDTFTTAGEVRAQVPRESATVVVTTAEAVARFALEDRGQQAAALSFNSDEVNLIPGVWGFSPTDFGGKKIAAVTVRNAVPGAVAVVTVTI